MSGSYCTALFLLIFWKLTTSNSKNTPSKTSNTVVGFISARRTGTGLETYLVARSNKKGSQLSDNQQQKHISVLNRTQVWFSFNFFFQSEEWNLLFAILNENWVVQDSILFHSSVAHFFTGIRKLGLAKSVFGSSPKTHCFVPVRSISSSTVLGSLW